MPIRGFVRDLVLTSEPNGIGHRHEAEPPVGAWVHPVGAWVGSVGDRPAQPPDRTPDRTP